MELLRGKWDITGGVSAVDGSSLPRTDTLDLWNDFARPMLIKRHLITFLSALHPLAAPADIFTDERRLRLGTSVVLEYFAIHRHVRDSDRLGGISPEGVPRPHRHSRQHTPKIHRRKNGMPEADGKGRHQILQRCRFGVATYARRINRALDKTDVTGSPGQRRPRVHRGLTPHPGRSQNQHAKG